MTKQLFRRPKDIAVFIFFTVLVILFFLAFLFQKPHQVIDEEANKHDLKKILERDTLIALTDYTSFSFFIYKGQLMGYQYELLQHFSDYLGVELSIQTENNIETSFDLLNNREVDLIAIDLTITRPRKNIVSFTVPINETKQVLIQRKPIGWQRMKRKELDDTLIRNVIDLGGKTVFIQENTAYKIRLTNLAEEIGDSINIREIDNETEDLIAKVAEGVIDYTVADYHVAMANATYYDNIDYNTPISFSQSVAWATRKGSDSLLNVLNSWLTSFTKTLTYKRIYRKYFVSNKSYHLQESEFHSTHGGKISRYDNYIKKYSKDIGWDWRLVASLIYEESRFNPGAKSWAGAYGLMQLMPSTARRFGVTSPGNPEQQIKGGTRFLKWLYRELPEDISDHEERIKFVLASYNIGKGHIMDAYRLAKKYGEDYSKWEVVERYLLRKSQTKFYSDPVVKYGYARGRETKKFVKSVYERYQYYTGIIPLDDV